MSCCVLSWREEARGRARYHTVHDSPPPDGPPIIQHCTVTLSVHHTELPYTLVIPSCGACILSECSLGFSAARAAARSSAHSCCPGTDSPGETRGHAPVMNQRTAEAVGLMPRARDNRPIDTVLSARTKGGAIAVATLLLLLLLRAAAAVTIATCSDCTAQTPWLSC